MKILIISVPRSGSTSLMNNISKWCCLKPIDEPFNSRIPSITKKYLDYTTDDIVVKTITGHDDRYFHEPDWNYWKSFMLKLIPQFDKTILLTRLDTQAQLESLSYAVYFDKWHEPYNYEPVRDKTMISDLKEYMEVCNKNIRELRDELQKIGIHLEIKYYEDFFDINSKDRLRQESKTNNTLL